MKPNPLPSISRDARETTDLDARGRERRDSHLDGARRGETHRGQDTVSAISNLVFVRCACALRPDSDGRRGDFRDWLDDERKTVGRGIK